MKLRNTVLIGAAVAMVATIQTAQATLVSVTGNLAYLAAGHSLSVGDKTFSGFSFLATGLNGFDANAILVTASYYDSDPSTYYLSYSGNMQLVGPTLVTLTADLLLGYTVTAGNPIYMIDQKYTGGAVNGSLLVNETATSAGAPAVHSQLSRGFGPTDVTDPNNYPYGPLTAFDLGENDLLTVVPPQTVLDVVKDISFSIFNPGGQVSISEVEQSFHQVPEPTTVIAGALLLLPLGASTLRILRRNRIG